MRLVLLMLLFQGCSETTLGPIFEKPPGAGGPLCSFPAPQAYEVPQNEECREEPEVGTFTPVVEWAWNSNPIHPSYHQIMMTPVVDHLTDDNGDGVLGEGDTPDILAIAFSGRNYVGPGVIIGVSGETGETLFSWSSFDGCRPYGASGIAVGDLDGDGEPSIIFGTTCGLTSINRFGAVEWHAPVYSTGWYYLWAPSLADLDADGQSEVLWGPHVVNADGSVRWTGGGQTGYGISFGADLDQDGVMEVIAGSTVYEADGRIRWNGGVEGFSGVADLDLDGSPEVVVVGELGIVYAFDMDGILLWQTRFPQDNWAGPPTLADYDGDGFPEIGIAFETAYRVFDGDGSLMWSQDTEDDSSGITGSAVFDFEGDGAAEVVYADEHVLYIYDGATGTIEMAFEDHASGTLVEYPVIVDIDGDNSAEIILPSNDAFWAGNAGLTIIGDKDNSWAPAREVWNQHAYHITNINDDSTIPVRADANWLTDNTFRAANSETVLGLARPDLKAGPPKQCLDECSLGRVVLYLPIENEGIVDAFDVELAMYSVVANGDLQWFDHRSASVVAQGEARWVGPLTVPESAFGEGGLLVRVDDVGNGGGVYDECDETNNVFELSNPCLEQSESGL